MWPPWRVTIGTTISNSSLSRATTSLALRVAGELGEVADVADEYRDLALHPLLRESLAEDVLGDRLVEVGAERLAQLLALGEALDHLIERGGQLAELVPGRHRHETS